MNYSGRRWSAANHFPGTRGPQGEYVNYFKAAREVANLVSRKPPEVDGRILEDGLFYISYAFAFRALKKLFLSKEGRVGEVPRMARPGDAIFIVEGAPIPFVLRPRGKGENTRCVGECYVHGIMKGERREFGWGGGGDCSCVMKCIIVELLG